MDLLTPKLEVFIDHDFVVDDKICDNTDKNINTRPMIWNDSSLKSNCTNDSAAANTFSSNKYKKKRQQCPKCPANYSKREYLSKHMKTEHNIALEKKPPGRQPQYTINENDPRPYKCDQCINCYIKAKHLTRHKRTHLETKRCNVCNEICSNYADYMLKKHGIDLPRPFQCDICKKSYLTKTHVVSHMRVHRAAYDRIYTCTVCPKAFSFVTDLRKHMKSHSQNRSVICDICGDAFKSADTLKSHMRRHTGERPYKCSQCPKAYSTSNSLDIHFRTHTGERPFQCEFCEKRFSDSSTLHVHKRLHTNENPYMCHLCGRRTKQASNLRSHYKHFHKNNDISGRQIRLNSRIFARFTQYEIDVQLQQTGDLMALLERGLADYHQEENEKNSQIEKAIEVIIAPKITQTTISKVEPVIESTNTFMDEIQLKEEEKKYVDTKSYVKKIKNSPNCPTKNSRNASNSNRSTKPTRQSSRVTKSKISHAIDLKQEETSPNKCAIMQQLPLQISSTPLKIESVYINDEEICEPHETNDYPFDEVKNEDHSFDDNWQYDNGNDSDYFNESYSPTPIEQSGSILKCEAVINDEIKADIESILNLQKTESINGDQIKEEKFNKLNETKQGILNDSIDSDDLMDDKEQSINTSKSMTLKVETKRCKPCNRKFHDMTRHWIDIHSGIERPYECFICHRDYKRSEHLKYHMRTHGDERNFICHVCGDAFFLSNDFRKHIMNRHQVERPHKCTHPQCKKSFKDRHALNVHTRTHLGIKPFACAVCSEAFSALSSLRIHERKHTGDKPYVCKFCEKAFADCSTHKQHERIHTGEKRYRCHLCDRRTAQAGNLKLHYRHYHKIIVKSVSMFMDHSTSVPYSEEIPGNQINPFESYPLLNPSRQIEE